jgi:3-oxoadipate enol-lactonase
MHDECIGTVAVNKQTNKHGLGLLNHVFRETAVREPALLLIHPLGGDLRFWDDCMTLWPQLSSIACDLRSAGRSPRASGPVPIGQHVADLEALREALGVETVIPVGCAIGAMTAAAYAAAYPERVRALALSNPAPRMAPAARAMLSKRAADLQRDGMAAILPDAVDKAFAEQPQDERYIRYYENFSRQDAHAYAYSILGIVDANISEDLAAVRCPTLVVTGAHDILLPPSQGREVHGLIARSQYTEIGDASHFAPFQKPEKFARLVLDFLSVTKVVPALIA